MSDGPPTPAPRRPLWRRVAIRLALVCLSLLVFLGLCEVVLRVAGARPRTATALLGFFKHHERIGWVGRPHAAQQFTTAEADVWISHDADGMRVTGLDSSIRDDHGEGTEVVWCLGDSTTWGWGVPDGATWVDHMNRLAKGRRVFRNLGATGYSALQEALLLREHLRAGRKPHRVLVLFCSNDAEETLAPKSTRPYVEVVDGRAVLRNEHVPPGLGRTLSAWLTTHSLVCNYVHYYFMRARAAVRRGDPPPPPAAAGTAAAEPPGAPAAPAPAAPDVPPDIPPDTARLVGLAAAYAQLRDACAEHGVTLHVATPYAAPDLAQVCADLGLVLTDLGPYWTRHEAVSQEPTRLDPDPHWNELGHRIVAEGLHEQLFGDE